MIRIPYISEKVVFLDFENDTLKATPAFISKYYIKILKTIEYEQNFDLNKCKILKQNPVFLILSEDKIENICVRFFNSDLDYPNKDWTEKYLLNLGLNAEYLIYDFATIELEGDVWVFISYIEEQNVNNELKLLKQNNINEPFFVFPFLSIASVIANYDEFESYKTISASFGGIKKTLLANSQSSSIDFFTEETSLGTEFSKEILSFYKNDLKQKKEEILAYYFFCYSMLNKFENLNFANDELAKKRLKKTIKTIGLCCSVIIIIMISLAKISSSLLEKSNQKLYMLKNKNKELIEKRKHIIAERKKYNLTKSLLKKDDNYAAILEIAAKNKPEKLKLLKIKATEQQFLLQGTSSNKANILVYKKNMEKEKNIGVKVKQIKYLTSAKYEFIFLLEVL